MKDSGPPPCETRQKAEAEGKPHMLNLLQPLKLPASHALSSSKHLQGLEGLPVRPHFRSPSRGCNNGRVAAFKKALSVSWDSF